MVSSPNEAILERLRAGEDPGLVLASLEPAGVRTALRFVAPLRWVTEPVWSGAIQHRAPETALEELRARGLLQQLPREPGRFVLADDTRATYLSEWDADELATYSAELTKLFDTDDRERLYHLMLANLDAAVALFEELFSMADERFDLTTARELLDFFERPDRRHVVDAPLADRLAELRSRVDTRAAWSMDYYRSVGFLDRPEYTDQLEQLLAGDGFRALQLVAMGGMGKTMLLRSFIARRCVPNRIPVARIDFDDVDPMIATRYPWLLQIALAHQLNGQVPSKPFEALLGERRRLIPALFRGRETSAALLELASMGTTDALAEEVNARYEEGLTRLVEAARPAVLVIDTLEVALLRTDLRIDGVISTLFRTLQRPEVRLVLAARYDVLRRVDRAVADPATDMRTLQLENFTDSEARDYLGTVRGIDQPGMVDAVLAKGDLMPFTLALYGDLVRQDPNITPADIAAFDDPQQLYLIERVLERIDDPAVLYALRYGVVARRLDRQFVDQVLLPYIAAALRRQPLGDDPHLDPHDRMRARFVIDEVSEITADDLWRRLTSYASNQSWVSFVQDPNDAAGEYLSFHPNVREPMRLVMEQQDVLRMLHDSSCQYFQSLMRAQPYRVVQWAEEAAYHLFHARGPAGADDWQDLLTEVDQLAGTTARGDVAAALTADDDLIALSGQQPRRWFSEEPLMSLDTLAAAHLDVALARLAEPAMFSGLSWDQVDHRLSAIEAMEKQADRPLVDGERKSAVWTALRAHRGDLSARTNALERLAQSDDLDVLSALSGVALSAAGQLGLSALRRLAARKMQSPQVQASIQTLLATLFLAAGDTISAEQQARLASAVVGDDDLVDFQVWLSLNRCMPLAAARLLARQPATPSVVARQGRAALLACRPDLALDAVGRLAVHESTAGSGTVLREAAALAVVAELEGRVAAIWGDANAAVSYLDSAASQWRDAGDLLREADARATSAKVLLDAGRVVEAERHIDAAGRVDVPRDHDQWIRVQLLRSRWLHRRGYEADARGLLNAMAAELEALPRGPSALAQVAVQGLALNTAESWQMYLPLLTRAVEAFRPTDAVLHALDGLEHCRPVLPPHPAPETGPLLDLIQNTPARRDVTPEDQIVRSLRLAELARVLDEPNGVDEWLTAAASIKVAPGSVASLRVLEAAARAQHVVPGLERIAATFTDRHGRSPEVALDALISWARAAGDIQQWAPHLDSMVGLLERTSAPSRRNAEVLLLQAAAAEHYLIDGDPAELLRLAAQMYQSLGDDIAAQEIITAQEEHLPLAGTAAPSWGPDLDVIDIDTYQDAQRQMILDGRITGWKGSTPGTGRKWEPGSPWSLPDPSSLVDMLSDPLRPFVEVGSDARMRIASPQLAELPWEAGWPGESAQVLFRASRDGGTRRVMRLQRALVHAGHHLVVDGVIGPQTTQAIDQYQAVRALDSPLSIEPVLRAEDSSRLSALILQLSHGVKLSQGKRPWTRETWIDYEPFFDTTVIDDPTSRDVAALQSPCSVVHIQATLEVRGLDVCLSFDSGQSLRHSNEYGLDVLSVTALDDLLGRLTSGLGPVVILEAVAPSSPIEIVRQVLLRNLFASELFDLGYANAVLAIGPVRPGAEGQLRQLIPAALAGQIAGLEDVGDLYRTLRPSSRDQILRESLAVPALFVEDPGAVRFQ
ncbi:hypothetical protein AB0H36_41705 [Kribbella sp. NPDC050820]|uniref:hypothetical protein n=1 Tax=Kribbella sp. NPDC050820 TaxID=3155408 RepID=UPI0033EC30DA